MNPISPGDSAAVEFINRMAALASSMDADSRNTAEKEVKQCQDCVDQQSGFAPLLLSVAVAGLPSSSFASIVLKNTVKKCWNPSEAEHCIQEEDKRILRASIIGDMIRTAEQPIVQRNLAETIAFIAKLDFPSQWSDALRCIVQTFEGPFSIPSYAAALSTSHSILQRYRTVEDSDRFVDELRVIFSTFFMPFIGSITPLLQSCQAPDCPEPLRRKAMEGLIAGMECLLDLSQLDVGDEFLKCMDKIVESFLTCLSFPATSSVAIELKSVVVSCVKHFLISFDEDFESYAAQFVKFVWDMIADPSSRNTSMDDLVVCGVDLLSNACRTTSRVLFESEETINMLLNQVAIPNLVLQEEEAELFETEPDMYIQRDIEGSDLHTRRCAASDLIRTLVITFSERAKPLLLEATKQLFVAAASDWRAKDAAIYIASSLVLDGKRADAQRGATQQNIGTIIPFETLVHGTILPELVAPVSSTSPLLIKADCLRFVATFRAQLDHAMYPPLLHTLIQWLPSENRVVSSYAAHALSKFIQMEISPQGLSSPHSTSSSASNPNSPLQRAVTPEMLQPHAAALLGGLCHKIQDTEAPNTYAAHCLLHILQLTPSITSAYLMDIVYSIHNTLTVAIKNPSNPRFSHYIFDSLSRCIKLLEGNTRAIEEMLLPNFTYILVNDVAEYIPYALQILSQLLEGYPSGGAPSSFYEELLTALMEPALYTQRGSIPAAVTILITYVQRFPEFLHHKGATEKIIQTVRMLVQLKNYDHEGLNLLTAMMLSYPGSALQPYLPTIYQFLLQRLQLSKTPKYVRIFIIFLSVSVIIRTAQDLVQLFEKIQSGLFMMILDKVWLPNMQKITGTLERKVCVVAMTQLLCECPLLQSNAPAWSSCVYRGWSMIYREAEQDDHKSFTPVAMVAPTLVGKEEFTNQYCPLEAAVHTPTDVCANITDPVRYFRERLCTFLLGEGVPLQSVLPQEVLGLLNSA